MWSFLWDTREDGNPRSLVAWELVVRSKDRGGLGLGNLRKKNLALLGKWLWRFPLEQQSLWAMVIRSKYGKHANGWDSNVLTNGSFKNPWKFISQGLQTFSKNISLKVGQGTRVLFWKDSWCGGRPFRLLFPRLFQLTTKCNA